MLTDRFISMYYDVINDRVIEEKDRLRLEKETNVDSLLKSIFNEYKENGDYLIVKHSNEAELIKYGPEIEKSSRLTVADLIEKINEIQRKRTQIFSKMLLTIIVQAVLLGQIAV